MGSIFAACNDELFKKLSRSRATKMINTLSEINMSFIPLESQVGKHWEKGQMGFVCGEGGGKDIQGDHSRCSQPPIDTKTKVAF